MDKTLFLLSALYIGLIPLEAITVVENVSYGRLVFIPLFLLSLFDISRSYSIKGLRHISVLILFTLYALLSSCWSISSERTLYTVVLLFQYMAITLIATNHACTWHRLRIYMFAFALGCLYIGYLSVANYNPLNYFRGEEAGNPNENAFMINYAILFLLIIVQKDVFKKWHSILIYSAICFCIFSIFILGSRNGVIMMCVTIVTFMATTVFTKINFWSISTLIIMIAVVYYIFAELPDVLLDRYLGIGENIQNNDMAGRGYIWDVTLNYLENHPLTIAFGTGWGTFVEFYNGQTGMNRGAHNFYLNTLTTLGVFGLALLIKYLCVLFKYLKQTVVLTGKKNLLIYLLLLLPLISMMTTNWEGRKWWFVISIFIYRLYKLFPKKIYNTNAKS